MVKFCLDSEVIKSTGVNIKKISDELYQLSDEIAVIRITNDKSFNFLEAIKSISSNIDKTAEKINLIGDTLLKIVEMHSEIQNNSKPDLTLSGMSIYQDSTITPIGFLMSTLDYIPVTTTPEKEEFIYTVKVGDTLWDISRRYGTTVDAIYNANRNLISNPDLIYAGWQIVIPGASTIVNSTPEEKQQTQPPQGNESNPNIDTTPTTYGDGSFTVTLPANKDTSTTTYMCWDRITSRTSNQYRLRDSAYANNDVTLNQDGHYFINDGTCDRIVVATTQKYGNVGDYIDVQFKDGSVLKCVIGDIKSSGDSHYSEYGHIFSDTINVVEYITNWSNGHSNPSTLGNINLRQGITSITNTGSGYL